MDSDSPPRKKLKQARLPFQILSPKDAVAEPVPSTNRKRHLSEDSSDDVVVVKVGKKSEEYKENETVVAEKVDGELAGPISEEVSEMNSIKEDSKSVQDDAPNSGMKEREQGNILQNSMKSTLANLFGKKVFDVTEDVGSCDCGCEEADSGDEAMEEYLAHCNKKKTNSDSNKKTPKEKSKRKSGQKKSLMQVSPSKESLSTKKSSTVSPSKESPSKKKSSTASPSKGSPSTHKTEHENESPKKSIGVETVDSAETNESEKTEVSPATDISKPASNKEPVKSSVLSKKTRDFFARWRKEPDGSSTRTAIPIDSKSNENVNLEDAALERQHNFALSNEEKTDEISKTDSNGADKPNRADSNSSTLEGETNCPSPLEVTENTQISKAAQESNLDQRIEKEDGPLTDEISLNRPSVDQNEKQGSAGCPIVLDSEKPSFPTTPTSLGKTPQRRLTPKQVERLKKLEEKEKQKLERENEKKRLRQEKDELKKKEKEEKEEQKRKEKEEKEKKKLAEQEQRNEEKKKKELLKAEEKKKKEEERRKLEEDKKKAEEEEERKKAKASALFTSFFVPKTSKAEREETPLSSSSTVQNFMPFEVKADMRVAPKVRHTLSIAEKLSLDKVIKEEANIPQNSLYLSVLKSGKITPKQAHKTWPYNEVKDDDDDISIIESDDYGVLVEDKKKVEILRAKFLQFHENHRPAYRGTWRKKSNAVTGRRPFGQEKIFDYEVDSADEWEEEEPGESLHGSDDEKEQESEDDYEVDNSIFVPHGYLSDDEGDEESEEVLSPETQKAKLKLLGEEFEAQMKSKTSALKPVIIVLTAALQASSLGSVRYQKLFERRAVWQEDEGPIVLTKLKNDSDAPEGLGAPTSDPNCVTFSSGPGAKKKIISEEALPALITLIHGNQNKRVFLTNEFSAFLDKSRAVNSESTDNIPNMALGSLENCDRPSTPSGSAVNPLALKWPGLPRASRISISNKIKELAIWGPCPEEGPMHNRQCWYVAEEIRTKYGVDDIKIPNTSWHYTLKPKIFNHSQSPNAGSPVVGDSRALITKFTKVMTPEEKQRQWEQMKITSTGSSTTSTSKLASTKGSTGKITAYTQQTRTPGSAHLNQHMTLSSQPGNGSITPSSSAQPQAKKRVPLLVSVPRGQQITGSSSHCSLLSRFEASASPKPTSSSTGSASGSSSSAVGIDRTNQITAPTSESVTKSASEDCIVLD
ncbi:Chromatin assembly factor 1 subunit A-A [Frankliniella fusca]|uniref:Chromatin assembly factor 1 subunit A-A n=1 Tax=Frankliniella fusca TaxID=407009 RepID=A0AAE1LHN4_9NEOP|nr:Chromatin assembly factor 1 subunit A-A [Frankliniella fusca]